MSVRLASLTALGLTMAMAFGGAATAGPIHPGDLIVADRGNGTLDDINPTTGALNFVIAGGFSGFDQGLAINAQGMIFVSDIGTSTIYEVDPTTGTVTPFSSNGVGTGPAMDRPFEMQFVGNTLYVADGGTPNGFTTAVYTVDTDGNRTLVAGNNGSSDNLFDRSLAGLAIDAKGNIYASAPTAFIADGVPPIYRIGTGTAMPLSTTALIAPQGLAIGAGGQLLAVDGSPSNPSIWAIDPTTGKATDIADNNGVGTGPAFGDLRSLTAGPNGMIYATDVGNDEIYQVDPATGDRTVIAGGFGALSYGIAVYPTLSTTPEPSGLVLLAMGAVGLVAVARRRTTRRAWASAPGIGGR